jgi:hypothetical protein
MNSACNRHSWLPASYAVNFIFYFVGITGKLNALKVFSFPDVDIIA